MADKLFFRKEGSGTPLIILHGVFGSSDNWLTVGKVLSEQHTVYMLDLPNHGQSYHTDTLDYPSMAEAVSEWMKQENISEANIIGHSMGGKVAMQLAAQFPEKIIQLIVVDIGPKYYPPHHQEILKGLLSLKLSEIKTRNEADERLSEYVRERGIRQFLLKNLSRSKEKGFEWQINLPLINEKITEVGKALDESLIYKNHCIFIRGANSTYIKEEDLPKIEKQFPSYHLATIQNAGHWVHAENPTDFVKEVLTYISNQ